MMAREFMNDFVQISLKGLAFWLAPKSANAVFYAEFTRTCIDFFNHIALAITNYKIKVSPTKDYPYGKEKVKNAVVMLPGILFVYYGFNIFVESYE